MIRPPLREPNGRLRRRLKRVEETLVAQTASQPHRRGEFSTIGATPWQRALKAGRIRDPDGNLTAGELEIAALRFLFARQRFLKAIAAPNGFAVGHYGRGRDLPPSVRRRWLRDWLAVRTRLGRGPLRALLAGLEAHPDFDEREWPTEFTNAVSGALKRLSGFW